MGAECGLSPAETLDLTPREFAAFLKGTTKVRLGEWKRGLWTAWHTSLFDRQKKLPRLQGVMDRMDKRTPKKQTPDQMLAAVKMITAAFGGEDKTLEKNKRQKPKKGDQSNDLGSLNNSVSGLDEQV